jgi:hypothetical protein
LERSDFYREFQRLIRSGAHLLCSLVDDQLNLQVSELYGAHIPRDASEDLLFFFNSNVSPEFFAGLGRGKKLALVVSSPYNLETYQIKGSIKGVQPFGSEFQDEAAMWRENFLRCIQQIGVPQFAVENLIYEPDSCFSFSTEQIYFQTPQMGTGARL